MIGDSTTRSAIEQNRPTPRLSQLPTKTDEIEVLESAAGAEDQQDKVRIRTYNFFLLNN